ncbi:hypothetical protein ACSBR1_029780 [Camellia fascicularis]
MASDEVPIPDPAVGIGVALGTDMEAEEAALLPLAERPFDAVIAKTIGSYGSISGPQHWHEQFPAEVRTLVDVAGFGPFCSGLIQMRAESWLYGALVERWWDTIYSFHFSSTGEMTLTPYDFSMLTGLQVGVDGPVPFDPDMIQWRDAQL